MANDINTPSTETQNNAETYSALDRLMHNELLMSVLEELFDDQGRRANTHLLTLNKRMHQYIAPIFYRTIALTTTHTATSLANTLQRHRIRTDWIKTLYIRIGCTTPAIPRESHPTSPKTNPIPCTFAEKPECIHLKQRDADTIRRVLELSIHGRVATLVIHTDMYIQDLAAFVQSHTFPSVVDVQIPAYMMNYHPATGPDGPFPNARYVRLAINGTRGPPILNALDYRTSKSLRYLFIATWDIDDNWIQLIINHVRIPTPIVSVAIERDRGMSLPCPLSDLRNCIETPWLTFIMSPQGYHLFTVRWDERAGLRDLSQDFKMEAMLDHTLIVREQSGPQLWEAIRQRVNEKKALLRHT